MLDYIVKSMFNMIYSLLSKQNSTNYFVESFYGKSFVGDIKFLVIDLKKVDPSRKVYVVYNNKTQVAEIESHGFIPVKFESKEYYKTFYKCKYIISNLNLYRRMRVKDKQIFVQTWHGHPIKNMVKKILDPDLSQVQFVEFNKDMRKWDYLLNSSDEYFRLLNKCFSIQPSVQIINTRMPRHNYLLTNVNNIEYKNTIRTKYNLDQRPIILITPTWREKKTIINLKFNRIAEATGCHIVIKPHPHDNSFSYLKSNNNFTIVDSSVDVYELLLISNYLISDYSSVILDFLLINQNIICHTTDLDYYSDTIGFLFDIEKEIGIKKKYYNTDEIIDIISNSKFSKYNQEYIMNNVLGPYKYEVIDKFMNLNKE